MISGPSPGTSVPPSCEMAILCRLATRLVFASKRINALFNLTNQSSNSSPYRPPQSSCSCCSTSRLYCAVLIATVPLLFVATGLPELNRQKAFTLTM